MDAERARELAETYKNADARLGRKHVLVPLLPEAHVDIAQALEQFSENQYLNEQLLARDIEANDACVRYEKEIGQLREENAVLAGRLSGLMRAAVKHDGLHIEPLVVLAGDDCESEPQATWSAVVTSGAQSTETLEYAHTFDELLDRVAARKEGRKDG